MLYLSGNGDLWELFVTNRGFFPIRIIKNNGNGSLVNPGLSTLIDEFIQVADADLQSQGGAGGKLQ